MTSRSRLPADPCTIVTWNANGLAPRSKSSANMDEFRRLLRITGGTTKDTPSAVRVPDLVLIQEARLKRSPSSSGQPSSQELKEVEPLLSICRPYGYVPIWSLAPGRNAGTLSLVKTAQAGTKSQEWTAFTLGGALSLMMSAYGLNKDADLVKSVQEFGSSTSGESGTSSTGGQKQATMAMFMKKPTCKPSSSNASAVLPSPTKHDAEGRMQFLRFASMDLLHTYVPNNGRTVDSNKRRRLFDLAVRLFLSIRKQILAKAGDASRPIIWAGDLNVARTYLDGTHHTINPGSGAVSEYWTDENKCYSRKDVANADPNRQKPGDIGIPGFTPNERSRFEQTLKEAFMKDVWRELHPKGVNSSKLPYLGRNGGTDEVDQWSRANYTWRGTQGRNQAMGRYQGKGQRIDYFLISDDEGDALERVVNCNILGYGEAREGFFCGSDHCPVVLVLKNDGSGANDDEKKKASSNDEHETDYDTDDDDADGCADRKMPANKKAKVANSIPAGKEVIDLT